MKNSRFAVPALSVLIGCSVLIAQRPGPAPPTNLRVRAGGPQAVKQEVSGPLPVGNHRYFDMLAARRDVYRTFSLRDQAQLQEFSQSARRPVAVTYDPANDDDPRRQDAAKIVIPADRNSLPNQVRVPIGVNDGSMLVTWDAWFGKEFQFDSHGIGTYKTFQFASNGQIWCEVRSRFREAPGGAVALVDGRVYKGGARTRAESIGPNVMRDLPLSPQLAEFAIQPETWTRYWALFESGVDPDWDLYSLWVADENQGPVQLFDRLQLKYREDGLGEFWLEYNTSANGTRTTGPLVGYVRNIVMLRNAGNPVSLLQRPLK